MVVKELRLQIKKWGIKKLLYHQNSDELAIMHFLLLQEEAERCRIVNQFRARKKELAQLNRKVKSTSKDRQSMFARIFNMGNRLF